MHVLDWVQWKDICAGQGAVDVTALVAHGCVVVCNKERGFTSHDVVAGVRRNLKALGIPKAKVGHAGTLDPLAEGVLLLLLGRAATARQEEFMHQEKEYVFTGRLGYTSDTYDEEGIIVGKSVTGTINEWQKKIQAVLPVFTGKIEQRVPAYSAVKRDGKKLYELARKDNIDILSLPVRQVSIELLTLTDVFVRGEDVFFTMRMICGSGTYVRSLVHDIGQTLEVGAVVTDLRRVRSGNFSV